MSQKVVDNFIWGGEGGRGMWELMLNEPFMMCITALCSSSQLCNHQPPNTNFIISRLAMTEMCRTAGKIMFSIQWSILVMAGQVIKLSIMVN